MLEHRSCLEPDDIETVSSYGNGFMFNFEKADTADKPKLYQQINTYLQSMIQDESDWLAGVSNASTLLFQMMPNINWAGFYLVKGRELVLGPFQESRVHSHRFWQRCLRNCRVIRRNTNC